MHLVDDKDDVAHLADLLDEALHAALELAAELRARDKRGEVKKIDLLASQLERHVARDDALGEALGNGRLADARLTDLAVLVLVIGVRIVGVGQTFEVFRAAEGAHHFIGDIVKVLIRDAHAAHHLVHLRQSEIFRALEAKSFVDVLPVFLTGDEHNGDILFTSGTKLRLHSISSLG